MSLYSTFNPEISANTLKNKRHELVYQEIETDKKLYLAEENFSAQKVKEAKVFSWCNSNKKNTLVWLGLQEGIF